MQSSSCVKGRMWTCAIPRYFYGIMISKAVYELEQVIAYMLCHWY